MKGKSLTKLILSIIICQLAGVIGSLFTTPSIPGWYASLQKPGFTPPNWVFSPVWISLFLLMGVSAYIVWNKGWEIQKVRTGLFIFGFQFLLNIIWSILFFGLKSPLLALIEIIILWFFILISIINFFKLSKTAGFLLLPYLFWVSFAVVLNFSIFKLNP